MIYIVHKKLYAFMYYVADMIHTYKVARSLCIFLSYDNDSDYMWAEMLKNTAVSVAL